MGLPETTQADLGVNYALPCGCIIRVKGLVSVCADHCLRGDTLTHYKHKKAHLQQFTTPTHSWDKKEPEHQFMVMYLDPSQVDSIGPAIKGQRYVTLRSGQTYLILDEHSNMEKLL